MFVINVSYFIVLIKFPTDYCFTTGTVSKSSGVFISTRIREPQAEKTLITNPNTRIFRVSDSKLRTDIIRKISVVMQCVSYGLLKSSLVYVI